MSWQPLRGYLTGSLDAVFRLPGPRYLVADYKTNWLGDVDGEPLSAWHYRPEALDAVMAGSDYPLQAMLYCVALHRFLRWRQPGTTRTATSAACCTCSSAGCAEPAIPVVDGQPCGVFGWRPPGGLVIGLSDLLDGGRDDLEPPRGRSRHWAGQGRCRPQLGPSPAVAVPAVAVPCLPAPPASPLPSPPAASLLPAPRLPATRGTSESRSARPGSCATSIWPVCSPPPTCTWRSGWAQLVGRGRRVGAAGGRAGGPRDPQRFGVRRSRSGPDQLPLPTCSWPDPDAVGRGRPGQPAGRCRQTAAMGSRPALPGPVPAPGGAGAPRPARPRAQPPPTVDRCGAGRGAGPAVRRGRHRPNERRPRMVAASAGQPCWAAARAPARPRPSRGCSRC